MRRLIPFALLLGLGCGKTEPSEPSTSTAGLSRADAKSLLKAKPIDKKAFESAVLGRSTREVVELLGPPAQIHNGQRPAYEYAVPDAQSIVLFIRDDKVFEIDWGRH